MDRARGPQHAGAPSVSEVAPRTDRSVTVVLLNYNGREDLDPCLESLRVAQAQGPVEVLVADNGSSDGSVEWLRERHPWVRVLDLARNWGFALGINRTIPEVRTPYFALLNNDTTVEPGWLDPLVRVLEAQPDVAAVQARIMMYDQRHIIQSAGGGVTSHGYGYDRGYGRPYGPPYDRPAEVFFASGGASLFRRRAWEEVGAFDPEYFMYHEDVDWCWRARLAGWRLVYEPSAVVYHKMGATTSRVLGFSARQALGERHRIRTLLKLGPMPAALKSVAAGFRTRDARRALLLLRCAVWNLRHLPQTLSLRRKTRVVRPREAVQAQMDAGPAPAEIPAAYRPSSMRRLLEGGAGSEAAPLELRAGQEDEAWLGVGWYPPSVGWSGGPVVRWMVEEGELLGICPAGAGAKRLSLRLAGPPRSSGRAVEALIELRVACERASEGGRPEEPNVAGPAASRSLESRALTVDAETRVEIDFVLGADCAGRPFQLRLVRGGEAASKSGGPEAPGYSLGFIGYRVQNDPECEHA